MLDRLEHCQNFGPLRQAKQILIVPGVCAGLLQRFELGMDGEHLLDEGRPKMQKPRLAWSFIVGSQTGLSHSLFAIEGQRQYTTGSPATPGELGEA